MFSPLSIPPSDAPGGSHPYQALTPDVVQDALASIGLFGDGRQLALNSYENRVYQLHLEVPQAGQRVVVAKFYRPGRWSEAQILEEHAFSQALMEAEIPVIGPLRVEGNTLHHFGGFAFSVSPSRGGRTPELDDFEVLEWIGRFLARLHTVGAAQPFTERPALDLQSFGVASREWLLQHDRVPLDVQAAWAKASADAIDLIAASAMGTGATGQKGIIFANNDAALPDTALRCLRLHGDCHPGNILWTPLEAPASSGPGPHFVDMDDARMGPAVQDLWMLLSGSRAQRSGQLGALVEGYEQFRPFDRRELALIEPLRTLRLLHYSAWLARRWDDPIFAINFPWFGSSDYWAGQVHLLHAQIEAMQQDPLHI